MLRAPAARRSSGSGLKLEGEPSEMLGRVTPTKGAGMASSRRQRRLIREQALDVKRESLRMQFRLGDHPPAAGLGKRSGVCRLVIIGCVRIGDQKGGPANCSELRHGRSAGTANHQMRPRQPLRHVGEKALQLCTDAIAAINPLYGVEIFRARLLAHPQQLAQSGW